MNLTLRSKVNVVSESLMYMTHPLMVIDPCAKYGMPMSKLQDGHKKDDMTKTLKNDLNVKDQQRNGNMSARVSLLMVIDSCDKYVSQCQIKT